MARRPHRCGPRPYVVRGMSNEREGASRAARARHPPRMNAAAFSLAIAVLGLVTPAAQAASPCEAPEQFVRTARLEVGGAPQPAPLLRPYVIDGIAAVAVREEAGQRWLELAVHSADDARRQLSGRGQAADRAQPVVDTWRARVWLRCPATLSAGA